MSNFLRLASTDSVTRIAHEGDEDWIEVRSNLSKKDMDGILRSLPKSLTSGARNADGTTTFDIGDASDMAYSLFKTVMVGWSLEIPCTFENYLALDSEPAQWIDGKLYEHFASLQTSQVEKGKASTSRKV